MWRLKITRNLDEGIRRENYSLFLLVGVAENEESAGLRHGNGLLLQLNVREWPRPRTHWHLWLILILIS